MDSPDKPLRHYQSLRLSRNLQLLSSPNQCQRNDLTDNFNSDYKLTVSSSSSSSSLSQLIITDPSPQIKPRADDNIDLNTIADNSIGAPSSGLPKFRQRRLSLVKSSLPQPRVGHRYSVSITSSRSSQSHPSSFNCDLPDARVPSSLLGSHQSHSSNSFSNKRTIWKRKNSLHIWSPPKLLQNIQISTQPPSCESQTATTSTLSEPRIAYSTPLKHFRFHNHLHPWTSSHRSSKLSLHSSYQLPSHSLHKLLPSPGMASTSSIIIAGSHNYYAIFQNIHDIASKRIMTLDYLRKAHEGRVYCFNSILFTAADIHRLPALAPQKAARRATGFVLLGFSLPSISHLHGSSPVEYLKSLIALLGEFEAYMDKTSYENANSGGFGGSLGKTRVQKMFKRGMQGVSKARRSSAAHEILWAGIEGAALGATTKSGGGVNNSYNAPLPPSSASTFAMDVNISNHGSGQSKNHDCVSSSFTPGAIGRNSNGSHYLNNPNTLLVNSADQFSGNSFASQHSPIENVSIYATSENSHDTATFHGNKYFEPSAPYHPHASPLDPSYSPSVTGALDNFTHFLVAPLPFTPDYYQAFTALCDCLIDVYTRIIELVPSAECMVRAEKQQAQLNASQSSPSLNSSLSNGGTIPTFNGTSIVNESINGNAHHISHMSSGTNNFPSGIGLTNPPFSSTTPTNNSSESTESYLAWRESAASISDLFNKADSRVKKLLVAGVIREFEDASRSGARSELKNVGRVALGGLI